MTLHQKIGGIHWFRLGRLRIAFCITKKPPHAITLTAMIDDKPKIESKPKMRTYVTYENNHFVI